MIKIPKFKTKKINVFFKKVPKILGEHAFLSFLGLLILALILGSAVFYKYSFLAGEEEPESTEKPLKFKEKTYQEILKIWGKREKRFEEADSKEYPDPFREKKEKPNEEIIPEVSPGPIPESPAESEIKELQAATNLDEFYRIKGEKLPSAHQRAGIWEEKGLGPREEYSGSYSQNLKLLEELKKGLTE
jgi:hypothetical protein